MDAKGQVTVERTGSSVAVVVQCDDAYAAMILYDKISESLKKGGMVLNLTPNKSPVKL